MFRANRVKTLDYTGKMFSYPSDFSLSEYMGNSWQAMRGGGEETEVIVKFSARIAPLIKEVDWHPTQRIEDLPDGSILYTATVTETKEVGFWVLSYAHEAEVIAPEDLREGIAAAALKMCQLYGKTE